MKNNNKNIVLEEYDGDFSYNKSESNLNISFNRIAFIFFIFFIILILFSTKAIYLGSLTKNIESNNLNSDFRSSITDRNGNLIAKTVLTYNVGINPNLVINKKKLLINLKLIFKDKNFKKFDIIERKLNGSKFFYIEKKITQERLNDLLLLGDKSIITEQKISRIYPQENLFSHLIGQIDDENNGISGIEKSFDYELKKNDKPLKLTLDTHIQYLIREELIKSVEIFNNLGSAAILMDINTGEILSLISLPDYNLNKREKIDDLKFTNKITKGVYELGSVFKTLTLAAAFQNKIVEPSTFFENLEKKIYCAGNIISEYDDKLPENLTAEDILIRSSNIGSVRIAQKLGIDKYKLFLKKIGILEKVQFDIEEVGQPIQFRWGKCKLATTSFGHGITTTPLQLAKAYSVITNGGYYIKPTVIKSKKSKIKNKILDNDVSNKINPILRKVVSTKEGTAHFADVKGYEVAGKTGTADKSKNGLYTKDKINTFVSVFPISKPKFVLLVLLDEPVPSKEYIYNYRDGRAPYKGNWRNTAGWTTVWITGQIIEKIGPILATKY
jgi:cell division protein FtsI (penicillin-binding protein 3)